MNDIAVIFDNDGVLVDSEGISAVAFVQAAGEQDVVIDPGQMERYCGLTDTDIAADLATMGVGYLDLPSFEKRKRDLYFEMAGGDPGVRSFAGVRRLVESLRDARVPFAVASSGSKRKVAFNLERAGLADLFEHRVSAELVRRGKPDPEIFLKATQLLGMEPSRCVVIEDSINGLKAARAAGMIAVGVTTTFAADRLESYADYVVDSLADVTVEQLRGYPRRP